MLNTNKGYRKIKQKEMKLSSEVKNFNFKYSYQERFQ